jgi:hypothetical protein
MIGIDWRRVAGSFVGTISRVIALDLPDLLKLTLRVANRYTNSTA